MNAKGEESKKDAKAETSKQVLRKGEDERPIQDNKKEKYKTNLVCWKCDRSLSSHANVYVVNRGGRLNFFYCYTCDKLLTTSSTPLKDFWSYHGIPSKG